MSTPETRPSRRGYFLPGFIAMGALLVIGVLFGAGDLEHPAARSVVGPDIAGQIAAAIQTVENARTTPDVHCPAREPVQLGLQFECTQGSGATTRPIYVTETDNRGGVRWSFDPPGTPST
ncbi:MAG TPA: DUF4333 domain-containing protein [Acidimicrobiales bacterium]|nr:DUF4333 domain-containing protein [Acidimicrobiales bacterium]